MRMYSDLAWIWPIISPPEDYIEEALEFTRIIKNNRATMLHLGCGGGHLDRTLKDHFKITGVDLSPTMLELAEKLNPECNYQIGDMRNVKLKETFDSVLIADSISYMLTEKDLQKAFQTAYDHLEPGGLFITYAEATKETFANNKVSHSTHQQDSLDILFIENLYDCNPQDTIYEAVFMFLIRQDGKILALETDKHTLGIFPLRTWKETLEKVGFEAIETKNSICNIPLFVAKKTF